uniref:ORF256 protein n=1 Tax=Hordeum bulbosum TaxID=4516 RepID=A0A0P0I7I1_HORBU|nr:ORF256 protein [Hordeum bulbosum]
MTNLVRWLFSTTRFTTFYFFLCIKFPLIYNFILLSICIFLFLWRFILIVIAVFNLFCSCFVGSSFLITLPPEIQDPQALAHLAGLNFYLSLYEQDPGWVTFIQNELFHNTPLEDIPGRLKLFLMEEKLSSMRQDVIQEFVALYQRVGPYLPIEPYLVDEALRSYLFHIHATDSFTVLQASYQDLRENEGGSEIFENAVSHNRDFLEAESSARRCLEVEQRIRWEEIPKSKASLEKAEHEHALDLFKSEDLRRELEKKERGSSVILILFSSSVYYSLSSLPAPRPLFDLESFHF